MNELDQFKQTYFLECEELLADLEEHLLVLQDDVDDISALHAAFRAVHSIKGGAGAFGFDRLVAFSHKFETVLDMMRDGKLIVTAENVELSVRAADVVADLVGSAQTGAEVVEGREEDLAKELAQASGEDVGSTPESAEPDDDDDDDDFGFVPIPVEMDGAGDKTEATTDMSKPPSTYHIKFVPHPEMFQRANEPLLLVRELKQLGAVTAHANLDKLPTLEDIDPENAIISWEFTVISSASRGEIEEVFEFVIDDCDFDLTVDEPEIVEPAASPEKQAEEKTAPVEEKQEAKAPAPAAMPKDGEAGGASPPAKASRPGVTSIRVDLEKLDNMVNMVGELVITQAMLVQQGGMLPHDQFSGMLQGLDQLSQHTRELQDNVMAMRAQPIKAVFSKIPRLVRELSAQTGKKATLLMSGENTEIDKTVIEQLSDPLTHMIRNSIDHGLEGPDERIANGKPAEGTIHLSAEHRGGRIVIEIKDDGRGINREKVLEKALEKGLVTPNSGLTDEEVDNLIFLPGFSTADQVSNISGRGVGMDVVLQNIKNMNGRVMVRSVPGKGSCFSLTLPLTLAVLDGMILRAGNESYVIPLAVIIESLRPKKHDIHAMAGDPNNVVMSIRDEYVPLVFLHHVFGIKDTILEPWNALVVVVEVEGEGKIGVVVDEIIGQQQVVIKSLEDNFEKLDGVAGATILGSGNVALILDVMGLKPLAVQLRDQGKLLKLFHTVNNKIELIEDNEIPMIEHAEVAQVDHNQQVQAVVS